MYLLLVADLSVVNANVYYALGIAVGLNKPILAVCDSGIRGSASGAHLKQFCQGIGLEPQRVLQYPNVDLLDGSRNKLTDHVHTVPLLSRKAGASIFAIPVRENNTEPSFKSAGERLDIPVTFERAPEAAVGVAVRDLHAKTSARDLAGAFDSLSENPAEILATLPISHLRRLPLRIPGTSGHILGTLNLGWSQIRATELNALTV